MLQDDEIVMDKLIINAAITGMVHNKEDNPLLPITPKEIADDVRRCCDAGACIVHIHARDERGIPTHRTEILEEIISRIKKKCPEIIICGSTSGRKYKAINKRASILNLSEKLRPELASITLGSLNFPKDVSVNHPDTIKTLILLMNEKGIAPELEIFDLGMIDFAQYLIDKEILKRPYYCNLFLGSLGSLSASPRNLIQLIQALPKNTIWSATGIGRYQFYINSIAVAIGGHVRVGLEDNLYYDKKKTEVATNSQLIERVVGVARAVGREIASPSEARTTLGLKKGFM